MLHGAPTGSSPQRPAAQSDGETQSALVAQEVRHVLFVPHLKGAQSWVVGVEQAPLPSQVAARPWVEPEQVSGLHWVPEGRSWPLRAPSQFPVVPQVETSVSGQSSRESVPLAAAMQVPKLSVSAQVSQAPVHARSQQTPSPFSTAQKPLSHWLAAWQARPFG